MARPPGSAIGRYQILDFITRGETTVVYQAQEPASGGLLALKILPPSAARDKERVDRFLRRADTLAQLDHANILPILDYGREEGVPFIAMPLAEGGSLEAKMAAFREGPAALALVASLAGALDYAHHKDFIHARIAPAHVLLDAGGAPLLTGFGQPYSTGAGGRPPAYVAPEQSQGNTPDGRTDIYQLGALLYELLLGSPPRPESDSWVDLADSGQSDDVQAILAKALASAPEERFQTAGQLLNSLNDSLERLATDAVRSAEQPVEPLSIDATAEAPSAEALSAEALSAEGLLAEGLSAEAPSADTPSAEDQPSEVLSTNEPAPDEPAPDEPVADERSADEPQGAPSRPALPTPAASAPQHAGRLPGRNRHRDWLAAAVVGLAIALTLCCLLSIFALFELNGRLREPRATAQVDTNVRSGPALEYQIIGLLREGQKATIHGVSPDGRWWQIAFEAGPGGVGWVPAAFVTVEEAGSVEVIPPPTLTPFQATFLAQPY